MKWHVDVCNAERLQRIQHRVHDRRRCAAAAAFTRTLDAKLVDRARRIFVVYGRDVGHVLGARHGVVEERAGQELAGFGIVSRSFEEGLAEPLHDAAVYLSMQDHRIEDDTVIVGSGIVHDGNDAGVGIDFDFSDMAAVGMIMGFLGDACPAGCFIVVAVVAVAFIET